MNRSVAPLNTKFRIVSRLTALWGMWSRNRNQIANPRAKSSLRSRSHGARFIFVCRFMPKKEFARFEQFGEFSFGDPNHLNRPRTCGLYSDRPSGRRLFEPFGNHNPGNIN